MDTFAVTLFAQLLIVTIPGGVFLYFKFAEPPKTILTDKNKEDIDWFINNIFSSGWLWQLAIKYLNDHNYSGKSIITKDYTLQRAYNVYVMVVALYNENYMSEGEAYIPLAYKQKIETILDPGILDAFGDYGKGSGTKQAVEKYKNECLNEAS